MKVLSIDIGASSGRFIVTTYSKLYGFHYEETYRFSNAMEMINGRLKWNIFKIMNYILAGLKETLKKHKDIDSIGIDTWAIDYVMLNKEDDLIDLPIAYRDHKRNLNSVLLLKKIPYYEIYKRTGIQYLPFNSIFELNEDISNNIEFSTFLLIPDFINFFLTGKKFLEVTNFSTTALYNPKVKYADSYLCDLIKLSKNKLSNLIYPSKLVGYLSNDIISKINGYKIPVISVGSHDTASAIATLRLNEHTCFISSGTRSLMGVELDEPLINKSSFDANFTNEIGLENRVRFLKNIMGLFIIQELKKDFAIEDEGITFDKIHEEASHEANDIYIDIDDQLFTEPGDMLNKFYNYLKKTNQYTGELSIGKIARCVYESMSFKYFEVFNELKKITGRKIDKLIIIGGGVKATLLNQLIANVLQVTVITGNVEATAIGNALAQLIYHKEFKDLADARIALNKCTKSQIYTPSEMNIYSKKYKEYVRKVEKI